MDKKIITYTIVAIVAFFALDRAAIIINTLLQYFMFGFPLVFQGQNVIWYNLINTEILDGYIQLYKYLTRVVF